MCDLLGQLSWLADALQGITWLHLPSAVTANPRPNAPGLQLASTFLTETSAPESLRIRSFIISNFQTEYLGRDLVKITL